jgi:hypothetical protein
MFTWLAAFLVLASPSAVDGGSEFSTTFDAGSGASMTFTVCKEAGCGQATLLDRYRNVNSNIALSERPPSHAPSFSPEVSGDTVHLAVRSRKAIRLPCAPGKAAFGNYPYDMSLIKGGVLVEGLEVGRAPLLIWCADGKVVSFVIDVVPEEPRPSASTGSTLEVSPGEHRAFDFPCKLERLTLAVGAPKGLVEWQVEGRAVTLIGRHVGNTTLAATCTDGRLLTWPVTIAWSD